MTQMLDVEMGSFVLSKVYGISMVERPDVGQLVEVRYTSQCDPSRIKDMTCSTTGSTIAVTIFFIPLSHGERNSSYSRRIFYMFCIEIH